MSQLMHFVFELRSPKSVEGTSILAIVSLRGWSMLLLRGSSLLPYGQPAKLSCTWYVATAGFTP
jgi:hypothetical protein